MKMKDIKTISTGDDDFDIDNDNHVFSEETLFITQPKPIKVMLGEFIVGKNFKRFTLATGVFAALASGLYLYSSGDYLSGERLAANNPLKMEQKTVNAGVVSRSEPVNQVQSPVSHEPIESTGAELVVDAGSGETNIGAIKTAIDQAFAAISEKNRLIEARLKSKEDQLIIFSNEIAKVKDEMDAVGQQLNNKDVYAKNLESQKNQLQTEKDALSNQVAQLGDLSKKLSDRDAKIGEIESAMRVITENHKKSQGEVAVLSSEIDKLNEENDSLRRENGTLNIKLSELRTSIRKGGKVATAAAEDVATTVAAIVKPPKVAAVIPTPAPIAKAKKDPLQGLIIIGLTEDKVVALKDNKPITISLGTSWNGVRFNSIDKASGTVSTSAGNLTMK